MRTVALSAILLATAVAEAQIVLKPTDSSAVELAPRTVDVKTTIRGNVASSVWTYTFANNNRFFGQADFMIAIPKGGVVGGFAYWYQGERVAAKITEKARAARIYNVFVHEQRDPALIELVGKNTFRVRVFPIDVNADLKVELRLVQVVPATVNGATLSLPLASLGKLEKASVELSGDGKLQTSWGGLTYQITNSKVPDLKVTRAYERRALRASLLAARSGGTGGFFALTLTPSRPLKNNRWRLEGAVENVMEVKAGGNSIVLVGRYRKPGKVRAHLTGNGYSATTEVQMTDRIDPNGPATKLWAWNRISKSKSRKEIVGLSLRHGVPSRYTSWIAIPTEERKRMAREIARTELRHEIGLVSLRLARVGPNSREGKRIVARIQKRAREQGVSLGEVWDADLISAMEGKGREYVQAVVKRGEASRAARMVMKDIDAYRRLGVSGPDLSRLFTEVAEKVAPLVVEDRVRGRNGPAAQRHLSLLRRAAARSEFVGGQPDKAIQYFIEVAAASEMQRRASAAAYAERAGRDPSADQRRVYALGKAGGRDAKKMLVIAREAVAWESLDRLSDKIAVEIAKTPIDENRLRKLGNERRRDLAVIGSTVTDTRTSSILRGLLTEYRRRLAQGKADPSEQSKVKARVDHLAELTGIPIRYEWPDLYLRARDEAKVKLQIAELDPRRDRRRIALLRKTVERLTPYAADSSSSTYYEGRNEPEQELRDAYVKARHRGESAENELAALDRAMRQSAEAEYWAPDTKKSLREQADLRHDVLRVETELDQLDLQKADARVLAQKRALEARAKELRARMGDPIVRIDAPDARSVVARMPDGSSLILHRVPGTGRWEGRFDVPPGAADGRYEILVYVDGEERLRVPITVDTSAPKLSARWSGNRVEVVTDGDVKRVTGLTPDGERLELTNEGPGRFSTLAPYGTEFIATDGAHNRSDMRPTLTGERGAWASTGNVSALARVDGRLWVGTANEGPDYPWIKAAVELGGKLAVRRADGTVAIDGVELSFARRTTAIAADGDRLLAGTIGGYFDGWLPLFPKELAGVVVTALLGDGERVWLGTQGRGIAEFNRRTGSVTWHDERRGLRDDWITCLGRDERGRIVAGTFVGGAFVLDEDWTQIPETAGACVSGVAGSVVATRQGVFAEGKRIRSTEATALLVEGDNVWIGTRKGPQQIR